MITASDQTFELMVDLIYSAVTLRPKSKVEAETLKDFVNSYIKAAPHERKTAHHALIGNKTHT